VAVSALKGNGIENLLIAVRQQLYENMIHIKVILPYDQGSLISQFHESGQAEQLQHVKEGILIDGKLPGRLIARFAPYISSQSESTEDEESLSDEESE
jgi:GTP-binding protein HflX